MHVDRGDRGGALALGAILVSTSLPLRTSPIKRGNWVLSQLLGAPPPPPPPVVPQISHDDKNEQGEGILAQMRAHRANQLCLTCHARIDPLGVALEGFDPLARHRAATIAPVDADLETTADGTRLQGFASLKQYLLQDVRMRGVVRNCCSKFLGYALGRALIASDDALLDRTMADLGQHGWHASIMIADLLASPQFLMRRDPAATAVASSQERPANP